MCLAAWIQHGSGRLDFRNSPTLHADPFMEHTLVSLCVHLGREGELVRGREAMAGDRPAAAIVVLGLACMALICLLADRRSFGDTPGVSQPTALSLAKPAAAPDATHFRNTQAVSQRDCKALPREPASGSSPPLDYLLTTAYSYTPYQTRAFLKSFRAHNQAARIVMLVSPGQARLEVPQQAGCNSWW